MLIVSIPQYVQGLTNAKADLTTTAITTVYTAPASADFNASVINSIIVSNDSGSSDTITLTITGDGVSSTGTLTNQVFNLFQVKAVAANTSVELQQVFKSLLYIELHRVLYNDSIYVGMLFKRSCRWANIFPISGRLRNVF